MPADRLLLLGPSGEIHTKSQRTRRRFRRLLLDNLRDALRAHAPGAEAVDDGRRLRVEGDLGRAADVAGRVFGVRRVAEARRLPEGDLDELVDTVADAARERVAGRTFAVRVRRRGGQPWRSPDVERLVGARLLEGSAGVDLDDPEVEVQVEAYGDAAYLVERAWDGAGGLPLGTQPAALALLSGGFDSPVAAWMLMRRGVPLDLLHFQLACAQTDHALAVGQHLWRRWGAGTSPLAWVVDFGEVRQGLLDAVSPRLRQVVLKELMFAAADRVAAGQDMPAIVTGESVGQVSSQTLPHLAAIDAACSRTVLRPLSGLDKEEIIALSRRVGTHDLSARAREVCDLSDGPVAVAAGAEELRRARAGLPGGLLERALGRIGVVALAEWVPGMQAVPVVDAPPADAPLADAAGAVAGSGPITLAGDGAVAAATQLRARGRDARVLRPSALLRAVG